MTFRESNTAWAGVMPTVRGRKLSCVTEWEWE